MPTRIGAVISVLALSLLGAPLAIAEDVPPIVAAPGGYLSTYATPIALVPVGAELTFVNGDLAFHDVIGVQYGPDDQPWCDQFPKGKCRILYSDLIPFGRTTDVLGTENLEAGSIYEFYCSEHTWMTGYIIATDPL